MSILNTQISLNEAATLIEACGRDETILIQGEPGIGKSAILKHLGETTNMPTRYVDCTLLDLGDLQMPVPREDCVEFLPNKHFLAPMGEDGERQPVIIMLDELGKANRSTQDALLTLLHEHRIGSTYLPEGSIVFATTNLTSDGVGDNLEAHARNRITTVKVRKPTQEEWMEWAVNNDIDPIVIAWTKEYAHAFQSYSDLTKEQADENPYIFNPTKRQTAFVSPRSLENVSHLVKRRHLLSSNALLAAMAGTVGESAARDMRAYFSVADSLPSWENICTEPSKAVVPDNPIAGVVLALSACMKVNKSNIEAWMKYMQRLPREVQFLFVTNVLVSVNAAQVVSTSESFTNWCIENEWAV